MLCLQVLASMNFRLRIMDVSSAFGQSDPHERSQGPLFATMPPTGTPGYPQSAIIKVLTAVYGLVNAPAVWRKTVRRLLISLGYSESIFDPCFYIMIADPLTKRLGNSALLRKTMARAKFALRKQPDHEAPPEGCETRDTLMSPDPTVASAAV